MQTKNTNKDLSYSMVFDRKQCKYPKYRHLSIKNTIFRPRESWVDDSLVHNCQKCDVEFSFFRRKHHCRNCGRIFCGDCSNHFIKLDHALNVNTESQIFSAFYSDKERVCRPCYISIIDYQQAQKLFHIINLAGMDLKDIKRLGCVNRVWNKVCFLYCDMFRKIQYRMPLHEHVNDSVVLENNKHLLYGHSKFMVQYLCNPAIDKQLKEKFIKFIPVHSKKRASKANCWNMMCTRDCQPALSGQDAFICLQHCDLSVSIVNYLLSVLKDCKIYELLCYIPMIIETYYRESDEVGKKIVTFLIQKANSSLLVSNEIFWKCILTCSMFKIQSQNRQKALALRQRLLNVIPRDFHSTLKSAYSFVNELRKLSKTITSKTTIEEIDHEIDVLFQTQNVINHPMQPNKQILCFLRENLHVKRSLCNPIFIPTECYNPVTGMTTQEAFLLKKDDLRQDKVILQCITLVDHILLSHNMHLNITDYKVLPITAGIGIIDIIPGARTIHDIIHEDKFSIQNYILEKNENASINEIREHYMKSCVSYCIIGYILGIGDRHLENIMISRSGTIFHIDFGYVLGKEPKLFSPEIRITPEMIDAMGGTNGRYYSEFKILCQRAYTCIRRHAPLFYTILRQLVTMTEMTEEYIYNQVMSRFMVGEQHDTAELHFITKVVKSSTNSFKNTFVDYTHETSITAKALWTLSSMSNSMIGMLKKK